MVVLTWQEERNIAACLQALARQTVLDFEVRVVDAASPDRTAEIVRELIPNAPVPIELDVAPTRLTIGEARNRGVRVARADLVAFLSADAEPDPRWVEEALASLETADVVFGRQIHAPHARTAGAAVRGLRYHFPDAPTDEPDRYASNVGSAFRKEILTAFPFGTTPAASAVDDILIAKRAAQAGYRVAYNPAMVVRHHDVDSWRAELAKNRREGRGRGEHADELGTHLPILAWGLLLLAALVLAVFVRSLFVLPFVAAVLWLPALRRAWQHRRDVAPRDLLLGVLASPPFDLAFLLAYLRARLLPASPPRPAPQGNEVET